MIVFENVFKRYGKVKVLDNVDLKVLPGEFVTIIGPSGAGKSTLLHLLIGAERLSGGKISVDGYGVNNMNERSLQYYRRRVGMVFQDYNLLKAKNVFENVAFALEVCGYKNEDVKNRVNAVLNVVGLSNKHRSFVHQLSGGERQRVAIARALVHNPRIIAADEPTGNLDPKTAKEIIKLLLEINKSGTTVILTTHNTDLTDYIKKRVVSLEDGRVISDRKSAGYHPPKVKDNDTE